jgi:two-component system chemotaxis response regulator CheB
MGLKKISHLESYLKWVSSDPNEKSFFLNALTIHTTSWFREAPHFEALEKYLQKLEANSFTIEKPFKLWCAACSTGQEVYSFALVLEKYRAQNAWFDYRVFGSDIDPVSVEECKKAVYTKVLLKEIPTVYQKYVWQGSGKTKELFALDPEIRKRSQFYQLNLTEIRSGVASDLVNNMDWVICRNVLIYFKPEVIVDILHGLLGRIKPGGILVLGHSEAVDSKPYSVRALGHCMFEKSGGAAIVSESSLKLLVIDDSETIRRVLKKIFDPHFQVSLASSAAEAESMTKENTYDLITLDLHMPKVDGLTWLKEARTRGLKTPVVIVSDAHPSEAASVLGAMEKGAQDYIEKSKLNADPEAIVNSMKEIISTSQNRDERKKLGKVHAGLISTKKLFKPELILLGASTGGTEALAQLLKNWPRESPPVVVVQHIGHNFSEAFAQRLAIVSGLKLGDIRNGEPLETDHIYLSLGDYHIGLQKQKTLIALTVSQSPQVSGHRPSVDFMFRSAALFKGRIVAALLTGMGKDGARGLLELKSNGAYCIAQDEESSVVFGMPKEAIRLGASDFVGNIQDIRAKLHEMIKINQSIAA